jgi:F-box and leucine-rich repeat protein 2/20
VDVPKLEVLKLSHTRVDDKALYVISKSCFGILQLLLESCEGVTNKGMKHVVKNCKQLMEINLIGCDKVHGNIIEKMVFRMQSLRKITVPRRYRFSREKRELFLCHGCLVR